MQFNEHRLEFRMSAKPARFAITSIAAACAMVCCAPIGWAASDDHPLQGADTSSPRATLLSFIDGCNETYERVRKHGIQYDRDPQIETAIYRFVRCLDNSHFPPTLNKKLTAEAAVCLKEVIDRLELPPLRSIPDESKTSDDEEILTWRLPARRDDGVFFDTDITIVRIQEGPRKGEYLFSQNTVDQAVEMYERVKHLEYQNNKDYQEGPSEGFYHWYLTEPGWMIPGWAIHGIPFLDSVEIYGQALWQWIGVIITLLLGAILMFLAYRIGHRQVAAVSQSHWIRYIMTLMFPMAAMLVPLLVKYFVLDQLRMSGSALSVLIYSLDIVFLLTLIVVVVGAGTRVSDILIASPKIHPRGIDAQLIRLVSRIVTLGVATLVFLEGGQSLGIPLTTLVAGAGVGGLALALGAQDALKNVFGSMMIILDKPYRVGERIIVKGYDGMVEEIGLRSTRIKLLTGHVATIPNEVMARSDVENVARRPHIRRVADIAIRLDTPVNKVERAVNIIREILDDHEGMHVDFPPRVFMTEFNRDSLNIRIIYWFHPPNYWDFLAFGQRVNSEIMQRFETEGIELALPTTTTLMAQDESRPLQLTGSDRIKPETPDADN
jgi:MscS family membrane protein